ncbi:SDR family NAD(P)-dependent oxidoreductase [Sphingosinicella soli]|uniref:NAD(P)-dependent dehydrogenase (Short-subunit alcohol dehydrogenase family) n=1 Tax=Sphingosinicella soli TaxID=333708 RepID=A0A7W7F640_9SPHN|nr:SDR family oxidoreductase [Sphingosinicella soli]MBB4631986.1 NAD(P)-dependent dehydrogenase (short-subunit alcohol dehydrogenase family) [Sphingosinicella soli]
MDLGYAGAKSVVVGGSRGLGRAIAIALAREGSDVVVFGRNANGLDKTVEACRAEGVDAFSLVVDMSENEGIDAAFREIGERWGHINVIINNAANSFGTQGQFETITDEVWQEAFNRITIGYARTIRAGLPWMRKADWARVVNLATASTRLFMSKVGVYNVTKSAVTALSKHLALDLAPEGILVNTLSPGGIMVSGGNWGPLINKGFEDAGLDSANPYHATQVMESLFGNEPSRLGRHGKIEEYVAVLLFVASRANGYMTGADINVDGGTNF